MSSCTPFINRSITEEVPCFREGKSPRLKGNPNFRPSLSFIFSNDQHTASNATCSNLTFFWDHLQYLGDYVHFLGINAHKSSSNNRCMKGCTRTAWKMMLVPFSKFSCLLQGMDKYFDEMCGNSQQQTFVYWVFNYRKNEINA